MLVVIPAIGANGESRLRGAGTDDAVAVLDRAVIDHALRSGLMEEVDHLLGAGCDASQSAYVARQAERSALERVVCEEELAVVVVQHHRGAIHLRMQERRADTATRVDTHAVEVVFIVLERVTGDGEDLLVAEVPFPRSLRLVDGIGIAVIEVMPQVGRQVPVPEESGRDRVNACLRVRESKRKKKQAQ